jgi:hypothetical protein
MEAYEQTMMLSLEQIPGKEELKILNGLKESREGIIDINCDGKTLRLAYQPYVLSRSTLEEWIEESGIQLKRESVRKGFLNRFIDRLAEKNEKQFGGKRLDCCDLSGDERR